MEARGVVTDAVAVGCPQQGSGGGSRGWVAAGAAWQQGLRGGRGCVAAGAGRSNAAAALPRRSPAGGAHVSQKVSERVAHSVAGQARS